MTNGSKNDSGAAMVAAYPWRGWSPTRRRRVTQVTLAAIVLLAGALRFYRLGDVPGGLYRDEAYNGLDALRVLAGEHAVFFTANNGREPAYIYLVSAAVALLGRTALAVRLPAALIGTLATVPVYGVARRAFDRRIGLLTAFLWATTLWPVHLSRVGLRPILLPAALALAGWLALVAWRRRAGRVAWLAIGALYGVTFYTYLAARLTPLWLAIALVLAWRARPAARPRLYRAALWGAVGTLLAVAPLVWALAADPSLLLGRTGQVSVFTPAVNGGDLAGALRRQLGAVLGMFFWRGDTIWRHNLAGRPVFDPLIAVPFAAGFFLFARAALRRRPNGDRLVARVLFLWTVVMLIGTFLAEDAPHFLRAIGVLPALLIFPARGLSAWVGWHKLPDGLRLAGVLIVLAGSVGLTMNDYFRRYAAEPAVAYLFESAARTLTDEVNDAEAPVYLDKRLWDGWASVRFLTTAPVTLTDSADAAPFGDPPLALFVWPYAERSLVPAVLSPPSVVSVTAGPPARGDLDREALPLYAGYRVSDVAPADLTPADVRFGAALQLLGYQVERLTSDALTVRLHWAATGPIAPDLTLFVHAVGPDGLIAQSDRPPVDGFWAADWWAPGITVIETHTLDLPVPFDNAQHRLLVGAYRPQPLERLPVVDPTGTILGDSWTLSP